MSDADDLLEQVMWLVATDITGLWEVVGIASAQFPEMPTDERMRLAKDVVNTLFARGWVSLYQQHPDSAPDSGNVPIVQTPVDPDSVRAALEESIGWDWQGVQEVYVQYLLRVTERGKDEFREQLRREGKVR